MITDSGGFQVFSLAHGGVADEIKGRRGRRSGQGTRARDRRGGGSLPLLPGRLGAASSGPRSRWRCRRRSAPTSRSPSTSAPPTTPTATTRRARWSEPTAGSIAASPGTSAHGPAPPGGVRDRPGRRPRGPAPRVGASASRAAAVDGIAIGGTLGPRQGGDARRARDDRAAARRPRRRGTCSGSASPTTCSRGSRWASTCSTARCRPGWPGTAMALAPLPRRALPLRRPQAPVRRATTRRWSRAAPARPAPTTTAPTSTTSREPRS